LDIAWFVSHGYITFTPDIHYTIGKTGEGAYNSIVAARNFISHFPWIDAKRIGIQGHSFGGYETNYVVTHTSLFAAAVSSSGATDLISYYGGLEEPWGGASHQFQIEVAQYRIGASLWKRQNLYIKNSPIFYALKVKTPLLMVSNKQDGRVPFMQGVELFTALRRLGKKAWMLQYDEGNHGLGGQQYIDYLIRMTQFFDHYLKGIPAPKWMTRGIPAKMKGIDDGLKLDYEMKSPGPGLLIEEIKKVK
jgi:dipeptidyl aminopeptidase/acylaminoacyl peptidase